MSYLPLNNKAKRQRVLSACKRCRDRKLGCDSHRPCELCTRAGVECISRDAPPIAAPLPAGSNLPRGYLTRGPTNSPVVLPESTIVDLSTLIFRGSGPAQTANHDSSALPGGRKLNELTSADGARKWRDLVGVPLPPDADLEELVNRFFVSVDWFMMVFHEDAFKRRFRELLGQHRIAYRDTNFSWLCLLVVAMGAHYSLPIPRRHGIDYRQLSRDLIAAIEARFLQIVGCATLETVQICILLGSFLLFNARPNAGLGVSASGVKIAQVLGLHRESLWKETSNIVREERRRTWWTLEVFDKYAAVLFGRPCIIDDSDCDVGMVSHVPLDGQSVTINPLLLYHQWKFRLYRIVGAFLGRRKQGRQLDTIHTIHHQMLQWRNELPRELRLATYSSETGSALLPQIQALSLQLTYDNLQIILHRTAAFEHDLTESRLTVTEAGSSSLQQLFDSAMETSKLYKYSAVLEATRRTHAEMHIGNTLFTAGVVLCAICLFRPLTEMGYHAKTGVMHIIRMCRSGETSPASSQHLISRQSLGILESLASAVLQREADLIIGKNDRPAAGGLSQRPSGTQTPVASSSDAATSEAAAAIPAPVVTSESGERLLYPIQEVFAQHFSGSASRTDSPARSTQQPTSLSELTPSGPEVANVFDWDGNLSNLVDQGLADASQLWLWADNLGYDTFNDHHLE